MNGSSIAVVGAALFRDGQVLVAQRGPDMSLTGKWEFPGGKLEPGETPKECLVREILEELCVEIQVHQWLGQGSADGNGRTIQLDVYACSLVGGEPQPVEHAELRWLEGDQLHDLDWAESDIPVLPAVIRYLEVK